jgi:hypothetical protein
MNFIKGNKYRVYCMEFRIDGTLKKIREEGKESDAGHFYDNESGFGGCVMARDEASAEKLIREEVEKRREKRNVQI